MNNKQLTMLSLFTGTVVKLKLIDDGNFASICIFLSQYNPTEDDIELWNLINYFYSLADSSQ